MIDNIYNVLYGSDPHSRISGMKPTYTGMILGDIQRGRIDSLEFHDAMWNARGSEVKVVDKANGQVYRLELTPIKEIAP